jgi:hypothetical protein
MSDQRFPDGEFAKQAVLLAKTVLRLSGKNESNLTSDEYLKTIASCVRALKGYDP